MDVSPAVIALDFAITGLLLFFVSYASYSILARKHLKTLMWASVVGNIILMFPIRDASLTPFIIAALFIAIRQMEQYLLNDRSMRLKEGIAARVYCIQLLGYYPLWFLSLLLLSLSMTLSVILSQQL